MINLNSMRSICFETVKTQIKCKVRKEINVLYSRVKILLFAYIALVIPDYGIGQSSTDNDFQANNLFWIDFYPHFYISEKFEYYGDTGYRTNLDNNTWHKFSLRPSARYHIDKYWVLHGGVGFFYDINKDVSDRFEIRPWQGIQLGWPHVKNLGIKHYVRFEQRISYLTDDWSSSLALRLRYMLSCRWDIIKLSKNKFWFIPAFGEVFFPVGNEVKEFFRDRGRVGVGLGYNPSDIWRFSFHVVWQKSYTGVDEDYAVSDIFYQVKARQYINVDKVKTLFDD